MLVAVIAFDAELLYVRKICYKTCPLGSGSAVRAHLKISAKQMKVFPQSNEEAGAPHVGVSRVLHGHENAFLCCFCKKVKGILKKVVGNANSAQLRPLQTGQAVWVITTAQRFRVRGMSLDFPGP